MVALGGYKGHSGIDLGEVVKVMGLTFEKKDGTKGSTGSKDSVHCSGLISFFILLLAEWFVIEICCDLSKPYDVCAFRCCCQLWRTVVCKLLLPGMFALP